MRKINETAAGVPVAGLTPLQRFFWVIPSAGRDKTEKNIYARNCSAMSMRRRNGA